MQVVYFLYLPLFYLITVGIGMGAYISYFGGKPYLYFLVPGVGRMKKRLIK